MNGEIEKVKEGLKDLNVDPAFDDNLAIKYASREGHIETVKILLEDPRIDPTAQNLWALEYSIFLKHYDVVKILLTNKKVLKYIFNLSMNGFEKYVKLYIKYLNFTRKELYILYKMSD
jgi:hypothetical protein